MSTTIRNTITNFLENGRNITDEQRTALANAAELLPLEPKCEHAAQEAASPAPAVAVEGAEIWRVLDDIFPNDPHLWQAMESLFGASVPVSPQADDAQRRSALENVMLHIERHIEEKLTENAPTECQPQGEFSLADIPTCDLIG